MKINKYTRNALSSVRHLVELHLKQGNPDAARAVLVSEVERAQARLERAVAFKASMIEARVGRGCKQANTLAVNKAQMLLRWAQSDLADFSRMGAEKYLTYLRGY